MNGAPPFVVRGALRPGRWNHVEVVLHGDGIRIDVNGTRRLTPQLPAGRAQALGTGAAGHAVDYTRPGALSIPTRYLYVTDHVAPFQPLDWHG